MWISINIMKAHAGSIGFTSEGVNRGCCFYFDLPLFQEKPFDHTPPVSYPIQRKSPRRYESLQVIPIEEKEVDLNDLEIGKNNE